MNKSIITGTLALAFVALLPNCVEVVDPAPATTEQSTTTRTVTDPAIGTYSERKTTTTAY